MFVKRIGAICSLIRSKGAKGSHLSWILSIHISTYPNPKLSNSDKLNFALKDISMYPKLSYSNKLNVGSKDTENDEIMGKKTRQFCLKGT